MYQYNSPPPLVSVIIPAFNCEEFINQAIDSILEQEYKNLEILITDDCSTDSTRAIIDSYTDSRIRIFHNESNTGNLIIKNNLFAKSTGTFITVQDADDWSHPRRISEQVELLLNNSSFDLCSTGFSRVSHDGRLLFNVIPPISHDDVIDQIKEEQHPSICYASILTYRHIVNEIGGICRLYFKGIGGEDIDFFYRLLDKYTTQNISEIRYYYRTVEHSITNTISIDNVTPLVVGPQLSYLLREQRKEKGKDFITTNDILDLNILKKNILQKYKNDIHRSYTRVAPRWASFQQSKNLRHVTFQYIKYKPFSLITYINILISYLRLLLGEDKYKILVHKLSFTKRIYANLARFLLTFFHLFIINYDIIILS